jgi:hypothetical protein
LYVTWNYRTKQTEFLTKLPADYMDYIPPVYTALYKRYVAHGDAPIEAAFKVLSAENTPYESDLNNGPA